MDFTKNGIAFPYQKSGSKEWAANDEKDHENIHNVYNYYDSFGEHGNQVGTQASSVYCKYGHTEVFYNKASEEGTSCNNHLIEHYIASLKAGYVVCANDHPTLKQCKVTLPAGPYTYTGKAVKPKPKVVYKGLARVKGNAHKVKYTTKKGKKVTPKKPGTYLIVATGIGRFSGKRTLTFKLEKARNPLKVKAVSKTVKFSSGSKTTSPLTVKSTVKLVKGGKGAVRYHSIKKGSSKRLLIAAKRPVVTVKKGTRPGTYKLKVKVTAAGNTCYKSASRTVTVAIKVAKKVKPYVLKTKYFKLTLPQRWKGKTRIERYDNFTAVSTKDGCLILCILADDIEAEPGLRWLADSEKTGKKHEVIMYWDTSAGIKRTNLAVDLQTGGRIKSVKAANANKEQWMKTTDAYLKKALWSKLAVY